MSNLATTTSVSSAFGASAPSAGDVCRKAPLHVLNLPGILLNGHNDSLEDSLRKRLAPERIETFAPMPRSVVGESLATLIRRTGERMDAFLASLRDSPSAPRAIGIGRSFGGFMLLAAAAQDLRRLQAFSLLVAVEAPLAADVDVRIPALLSVLLLGAHHFDQRPHHSAEMLEALRNADCSRIVTIGTEIDMLPPESHKLAAWQSVVAWPTERLQPAAERRGGTHVVLCPFEPGFALETALLPATYRSHMTWSKEKHAAIADIIEKALHQTAD